MINQVLRILQTITKEASCIPTNEPGAEYKDIFDHFNAEWMKHQSTSHIMLLPSIFQNSVDVLTPTTTPTKLEWKVESSYEYQPQHYDEAVQCDSILQGIQNLQGNGAYCSLLPILDSLNMTFSQNSIEGGLWYSSFSKQALPSLGHGQRKESSTLSFYLEALSFQRDIDAQVLRIGYG